MAFVDSDELARVDQEILRQKQAPPPNMGPGSFVTPGPDFIPPPAQSLYAPQPGYAPAEPDWQYDFDLRPAAPPSFPEYPQQQPEWLFDTPQGGTYFDPVSGRVGVGDQPEWLPPEAYLDPESAAWLNDYQRRRVAGEQAAEEFFSPISDGSEYLAPGLLVRDTPYGLEPYDEPDYLSEPRRAPQPPAAFDVVRAGAGPFAGEIATDPYWSEFVEEHGGTPSPFDISSWEGPLKLTSAEQSFGLPRLPVPFVGDVVDAALSPLSLAGFGSGLGRGIATAGLRGGLSLAGRQAATRGLPAIGLGVGGAEVGGELGGTPGALAGALLGGVVGWQAPELGRAGMRGLSATGRALGEFPETLARSVSAEPSLARRYMAPEVGLDPSYRFPELEIRGAADEFELPLGRAMLDVDEFLRGQPGVSFRASEVQMRTDALEPLKREAAKYDDFKEFSHDYSISGMTGRYFHATDDPNFAIREDYRPMDVIAGQPDEVGLSLSSDPLHWYPSRKYIAEVDLSQAKPGVDYKSTGAGQVSRMGMGGRGFGQEFIVTNPGAVRVVSVRSREAVARDFRRYEKAIPQSEDELRALWDEVHSAEAPSRGQAPPRTPISGNGSEIAGPLPREPRAPTGDLIPPRDLPPDALPDASFHDVIATRLKQEWYYRISGRAKAALGEGRQRQAGGIVEGIRQPGTATEQVAAARAGASGAILEELPSLRLSEAQLDQANTDIVRALSAAVIKPFEVLQAARILDTLQTTGKRLQPAQLRLAAKLWSEDVADLAKAARGVDTDAVRVNAAVRAAENMDRQLGRQRAILTAQIEQAQRIGADIHTRNVRAYRRAAEAAQAKAQRLFNEADAKELRQARAWQVANRPPAERAQARIDEARRKLAAAKTPADKAEAQRELARAQNALNRPDARLANQAARTAERTDTLDPNVEMVEAQARKLLGEVKYGSDALNREAVAAIGLWQRANRMMLDAVGTSGHRTAASIRAMLSGNVADSYATALITQRNILTEALKQTGIDEDLVRKVAGTLSDAELKRRFPADVPKGVITRERTRLAAGYRARGYLPEEALKRAAADVEETMGWSDEARRIHDLIEKADAEAGRGVAGFAQVTQEWKNLLFAPIEVSILGIQAIKNGVVAGPPLLAGTVNRMLTAAHAPHIDIDPSGAQVSRRVMEILDGAQHNVASGFVDVSEYGTLLHWFGKPGQAADVKLTAAIRAMNNLQFGKILGTLRSLNHDGNLVLSRLAGTDITSPAVRRTSAAFANAHPSAGTLALTKGRRAAEQSLLLTPSMFRARAQEVGLVLKAFRPGASRTERVLAASAIFSTAVSTLAIGKFLNDWIGLEEFEFDPSKPGFGNVVVPGVNGGRPTVINLFPQEQLVKAIGQSIRALAEADPEELREAWTKVGLGSLSPLLGSGAKLAGYGFDPAAGKWAFGDYGQGMEGWERWVATLPTPPFVSNILFEGLDVARTPLAFGGVSSFAESPYFTRERELANDPELLPYRIDPTQPVKWENLDTLGREKAKAKGYVVESRDEEIAAREQRAKEIRDQARQEQEQDDFFLRGMNETGLPTNEGVIDVAEWKERRTERLIEKSAALEELYHDLPDLAARDAIGRYYDALDASKPAGIDKPDFDKVEEWLAQQPAADQARIEEWLGSRGTAVEQELYRDRKAIADSGYWEFLGAPERTQSASSWRLEHPEADALIRKWDYSPDITTLMDMTGALQRQQAASDDLLTSQQIDGQAWKADLRERQQQLAGARDALFADLPERDQGPLGAYFEAIDANTRTDGNVDWDAVDVWVAGQPEETRTAIASRARSYLSPMVERYYTATGAAEDSGYFDLRETAWQALKEQHPAQLGDLGTYEEYREAEIQSTAQEIIEAGHDPRYARPEAERLVDGYKTVEVLNEFYRTEYRHAWVVDHPDLAKELWFFGVFSPDKPEREFLHGTRKPVAE